MYEVNQSLKAMKSTLANVLMGLIGIVTQPKRLGYLKGSVNSELNWLKTKEKPGYT
jgi:hypothetical protein